MKNLVQKYEATFRKWKESGLFWLISMILGTLLLPIISATITSIITVKFIAPNQKQPHLVSKLAWNSGMLKVQPQTQLKLKYKKDITPFIFLSVKNEGTLQEEDLRIELEIQNNLVKKATVPKKKYVPNVLRRNVKESEHRENLFYEYFNSFPANSIVEYTILTEDYIKNNEDIISSIMSKTKNWTPNIIYNVRRKFSFISQFFPHAWAGETLRKKEDSKDENWATDDSIGGYSPIVMTKGLSNLLMKKDLITEEQFDSIQERMKRNIPEAVFGGIDVVELNLLILDILESNKIFVKDQITGIIDQAKSAGGIMIMGYNIIILQVAILDNLILNQEINIKLEEAQDVINKAQIMPRLDAGHIP